LLIQALNGLESVSNFFLLSFGSGAPTIDAKIPHLHIGPIDNDRLLPLAFSAADVFVIPSLQEAFGQTALEAMACGTPIIGFAVGGIPDIVQPGITGLLVPPQDMTALRGAVIQLLEDPERRAKMSENCRRIAVEKFELSAQARRYVELYETILHQRKLT